LTVFAPESRFTQGRKPTPEALKQAAMMKALFSKEGLFGEIKSSDTPVIDEADITAQPVSVSPAQLDSAIGLFSRAFYLSEFMDKARIESDTFLLPNSEQSKLTVEWGSVKSVSGTELKAPDEKEADEDGFPRSDNEIPLNGYSEEDPLYEASGNAKLVIPVRYLRLDLAQKDQGKALTKDGYEVRLLSIKNDVFSLDLRNLKGDSLPEDGMIVIPMGKSGQIKRSELSQSPTEMTMPEPIARAIADLESGRRTVEEVERDLSKLQEELQKTVRKDHVIITGRATGTVVSVSLFIPVETAERSFRVTATTEPGGDEESPEPLRAPRYAKSSQPSFRSLSAEELRKGIAIRASRSGAMFGYNTPEIVCALPSISNSDYAKAEFRNVKLINKQKRSIPYQPEESGYISDSRSFEIRFLKPDGEGYPDFANATGGVYVKYPLRITTISIRRDGDGDSVPVTFSGRFVKIRTNDLNLPESGFSGLHPIRAFDATGRELVRLSGTGYEENEEGSFETTSFWGEPTRLEIDTVEEWSESEIKFDLPPAKVLPKP
jgi:hypothetical protein